MLFDEIKSTLAECIFSLACQQPFAQSDTLLVVNFLKSHCHSLAHAEASQKTPAVSIESTNLYLIMALLYCFDCSYLENRQSGRRNLFERS